MISRKIAELDEKLILMGLARNKALRTMRLRCRHLHLAEEAYRPSDFGKSTPPYRICMDCGAIEEGWHCGYQVLYLPLECTAPAWFTKKRTVQDIKSRYELLVMKLDWPLYLVGQSHKNFSEHWDYKSLTAIPLPGKKTQ
jgi:hypothetical protein